MLANRGIVRNVGGYTVYGDSSQPNPPARIIYAVANGDGVALLRRFGVPRVELP